MDKQRVYVPVLAAFKIDGAIVPRCLRWKDGTVYAIDKVIDCRPAAALKAGGQGDRYTIIVRGRSCFLYFERNASLNGNNIGRWFVEG